MSHPRPHDDCHRRMDVLLTAVEASTDRAQAAEKALYVVRGAGRAAVETRGAEAALSIRDEGDVK